ncbi:MAG: hypothetical protein CMH03_00075 [Marinovum sp.]|nr:hypothetical protein [Marinovum sp.]|tara:strand:- start:993 stop:2075 length:1083 start_codon:yes stop_codon:yes gene_type:complete
MGIIAFLSAISISAVAALYSILGLAAIFSGAKIPIMIMGGVLEVGKLVTASWLYQNWKNQNLPKTIKYYLTTSVIVLVFVTSMGIFGFLSKAHLDQVTPTSSNVAKVELIDKRILQEERTISRAEKTLVQLDKSIEVYLENDYATRGLRERRKQEAEREELNLIIDGAMTKIDTYMLERQNLELEQSKIEAEVGPLKYIAELIYGDNAKDYFDEAVRWVIIVLIFVFDPLAVLLLIAANISLADFMKGRQKKKQISLRQLDLKIKRENEKHKEASKQIKNYKDFFTKLAGKRLTNEDYEKFFQILGNKELRAMGLDPDEIRIKMDQVLDWNATEVKEMPDKVRENDKTLTKSMLDNDDRK